MKISCPKPDYRYSNNMKSIWLQALDKLRLEKNKSIVLNLFLSKKLNQSTITIGMNLSRTKADNK